MVVNPEFYKQVFGIVLTAILLTGFEIGFFLWQVAPKISENVKSLVSAFAKDIALKYPDVPQLSPRVLDGIVKKEQELLKKLHQSIIFDAMWVAGILVVVLGMLAYALKGAKMKVLDGSSLIFIIGSFVLFAFFQVFFFFKVTLPGQGRYKYPTMDESAYVSRQALLRAVEEELAKREF